MCHLSLESLVIRFLWRIRIDWEPAGYASYGGFGHLVMICKLRFAAVLRIYLVKRSNSAVTRLVVWRTHFFFLIFPPFCPAGVSHFVPLYFDGFFWGVGKPTFPGGGFLNWAHQVMLELTLLVGDSA